MILLGTNAYAAQGENGRRQAAALATWRGLAELRPVNLQWADDVYEVEGFATEPSLRLDSRVVSGRQGPRKPIVREMLDRMAERAEREGARWFGYANSDVQLTPAVVERMEREGRQAYAFARMELDGATGAEGGMLLSGTDAFFFTPTWWRANRQRFRAYIAGEPIWDNVFTAITLCHSDGLLLDREPLVRHESHPAGDWTRSPFAPYLRWLSALDAPYFSLWAAYFWHVTLFRAAGASAQEEAELRARTFRFAPTAGQRVVHAGRVVKAHLRYRVGGR
ncbi:MAG: glycosyltransferase and protein [Gemmatimonadetes bacterium]|nr:glycosyltransferase and protein [Gemmatimonadota bacterium]